MKITSFLFALAFIVLANFAFSLDHYWVGGTGNWSVAGNWSTVGSGSAPTATLPGSFDNVIFDGAGMVATDVVTMDIAVDVYNFDFSAAPSFVLTSALPSIQVRGSLIGNGAVTFGGWTGDIIMNNAGVDQLLSNGTIWNQTFRFPANTGTIQIADDFFTTGDFHTDLANLFAWGGITMTFKDFYSNNVAAAKVFNFSTSTINLEGTIWDVNPTNMSLIAGIINANNPGAVTFTGGGQVYNDIISSSSNLTVNNDNTFSLISLAPASQLTLANGSLQLFDSLYTDCGPLPTTIFSAAGAPGQLQKTGYPNYVASHLTVDNVNALSPGSETYSLVNSTLVNGSIGWTSSATSNYYWIGGTGNWSDGNNWSATSGGAPLGCLPGIPDNVIFDAASGLSAATTVTMDVPVVVNIFDFSTAPAFVLTSALPSIEIRGHLSGNGLVTFAGWAGDINLNSAGSNILTSNGTAWMQSFHFTGVGTVIIADNLTTTLDFYVDLGSVISNNNTLTFRDFYSNIVALRVINFDNSVINFEGTTWDVDPTSYTWTSSPSTIFTNNTTVVSFTGGNQIYDTIRSMATELQINNSNTFSLLSLAAVSQLTLENGSLQSIDSLYTTGSCGTRTSIVSAIPAPVASAEILKIGFPDFSANYLSIENVDAMSPGSETYSIAQSDTTNGADGWSLTGRPFYWIGDAGSWSDGNNWSNVSGGAPIGCIPSRVDSVFFDAASFSTGGQTVLIDLQGEFKTMDWTGTTGNQTLALDSNLMSFGDVIFVSNLSVLRNLSISGIQFNNQALLFPNSSTIDCSF